MQAKDLVSPQMPIFNPVGIAGGLILGVTIILIPVAGYTLLRMGHWLYEPWQLDSDDKIRYVDLVKAYERMGLTSDPSWTLTGKNKNQPILLMNYSKVREQLDKRIEELTLESSSSATQITILAELSRYLESIGKRNWAIDYTLGSHDRPDGIEAMFLGEFISWFVLTVPKLHEDDESTIVAFEKRMKYCKEVLLKVTELHSHNAGRANFRGLVERLTQEMKDYHEYLVQKSNMVSFYKKITKLSNLLLKLSIQSIHTLHLLIEGVDQPSLNVNQFLDPNSSDPKVIAMRNTALGTWLYQFLMLAGINTASFEATNALSLNEIEMHLKDQHPDDEDCNLRTDLRNATSSKWGHWPFATIVLPSTVNITATIPKTTIQAPTRFSSLFTSSAHSSSVIEHNLLSENENKSLLVGNLKVQAETKAKNYLNLIRDLHRLTLRLYHIRSNVIKSRSIASVFGEEWIYGNPAGKAALDELLNSVVNDVELYQTHFKSFWELYFKDYSDYAETKKINSIKESCHKWLNKIDTDNEQRNTTVNDIIHCVNEIRANARKLPDTIKKAKKTQKEFFTDILALMVLAGKKDTDNYRTIQKALDELLKEDENKTSELTIVTSAKQITPEEWKASLEVTVFQFQKDSLPYYSRVDAMLQAPLDKSNTIANLINNLSLLRSHCEAEASLDATLRTVTWRTILNSKEMSHIYYEYLGTHIEEVTHFMWTTFRMSNQIPYNKFEFFKDTYLHIFAVFNFLFRRTKNQVKLQEIEIFLIANRLRKVIEDDFKKHEYFPSFFLSQVPLATVKDCGQSFEVTVDEKWLNLGKTLLSEELKELKQVIIKQKSDLAAVTVERDELWRKYLAQGQELTSTQSTLTSTQSALTSTQSALTSTQSALTSTQSALTSTTTELFNMTADRDKFRASDARHAGMFPPPPTQGRNGDAKTNESSQNDASATNGFGAF